MPRRWLDSRGPHHFAIAAGIVILLTGCGASDDGADRVATATVTPVPLVETPVESPVPAASDDPPASPGVTPPLSPTATEATVTETADAAGLALTPVATATGEPDATETLVVSPTTEA
ncbi:MAG: hypothetical protein M3P94_03785, partial [Chloroflexota bacterium]|nr:hypothetical protein [Chloroflexota bacterium]